MQFIGRVNRLLYWLLTVAVVYFNTKAKIIGVPNGPFLALLGTSFWVVVLIARFHDCSMPTLAALAFLFLTLVAHMSVPGNEGKVLTLLLLVLPGVVPGGPNNRWGLTEQGIAGLFHKPERSSRPRVGEPSKNSTARRRGADSAAASSLAQRRLNAIKTKSA